MSDHIIELVQLENGDIALCSSDTPDQPLVTISISKHVQNLLPGDKIDIANAMIEAGIERYQEIQFDRTEDELIRQEAEIGTPPVRSIVLH